MPREETRKTLTKRGKENCSFWLGGKGNQRKKKRTLQGENTCPLSLFRFKKNPDQTDSDCKSQFGWKISQIQESDEDWGGRQCWTAPWLSQKAQANSSRQGGKKK